MPPLPLMRGSGGLAPVVVHSPGELDRRASREIPEESSGEVDVEALPRKTRKLLRRLGTDGNFLSQFR